MDSIITPVGNILFTGRCERYGHSNLFANMQWAENTGKYLSKQILAGNL
jgi:hypothetical protein